MGIGFFRINISENMVCSTFSTKVLLQSSLLTEVLSELFF